MLRFLIFPKIILILQAMKSIKLLSVYLVFSLATSVQAQTTGTATEIDQISETIMDYIEGTANGQPDRLRKAFHSNFNLYTVTNDTLQIRSGEKYISNIKEGEKSNRLGRIISIDFEKDAAVAKAEIIVPGWRVFTDYFLLLKYQGSWKIVQKSYSWKEIPKTE